MIYHSPTRQRNCGGSTKAFQCSTPHCTAAQYRWGKQGSEIADREGKPFFFFFACQSAAGNSPLSQLLGMVPFTMIDNKETWERSFQNDVRMNSQVSRVWHGFLSLKGFWVQRILEPLTFHGCPGLTLHGQYQESCTIMMDRHGRSPQNLLRN